MMGEASEYSKEFSVVDVVIPFSFVECLGVEAYCDMFSSVVFLS
jgi:hypothetical protein